MARFLALRTVYMILVMIGISILVFALSRMSGDPRYLYMTPGTRWSAEVWEARGKALGLDKPLVIQYLLWAGGAVRGDFGESIWHKRNSLKVIRERAPATIQLSAISLCACHHYRHEPRHRVGCDEGKHDGSGCQVVRADWPGRARRSGSPWC